MTATQLNYTNRIDIQSSEIEATYQVEGDHCKVTLKWLLGHYALDEDCEIFIGLVGTNTTEARRIQLGSLGDGNGSEVIDFRNLRNPELMKLRFLVVKVDDRGIPMIRADLSGISPLDQSDNSKAKSFLKIIKQDDLMVPWRLSFNDEEPIIVISGRQDLYQQLRESSPIFNPLVLSEVVRQVFEWMALSDDDFSGEVSKQWIKFFTKLSCPAGFLEEVHSADDEEQLVEVREMAQRVSEEFARKFGLVNAVAGTFVKEGN